jgi:hypothetical protein
MYFLGISEHSMADPFSLHITYELGLIATKPQNAWGDCGNMWALDIFS